jgi:hypothetical protein
MRVGLLTYHDESSTATYIRSAIQASGDDVVELGLRWPRRGLPNEEHDLGSAATTLDALLFVDPAGPFWPAGIEDIGCPTAAYLIDTHQDLGLRLAFAPFFDHIFVAQRDDVAAVRERGYPEAAWLPLAAEPRFAGDPLAARPLDVAFVGQPGLPGSLRHEVLRAIASAFNANDVRQRYTPTEMADLYGRAKIVVNASLRGDVNMRVFEATVAGALLVTDRVSNGLDQILTENDQYVGYDSAAEAVATIRRCLDDDDTRVRVAASAQRHVLAHHTYMHRWISIRDRLISAGEQRRALLSASPAARREAYARVYDRLGRPDLVWRSTRPWLPRRDSLSNLRHVAMALGRLTNRVVPVTPRAVRARMQQAGNR